MKVNTALLSLLLLPSLFAAAAAEENAIIFTGVTYPIEVQLPPAQKVGSVYFETSFSEIPAAAYDAVLIQGELSDPGVSLELVTSAARYSSATFHRFPNGRFWARYHLPLGRQPLKLSVVNLGAKAAASLTIFETELLTRENMKEALPPAFSTATYIPDPELFLPLAAPFKLVRRASWNAAPPTQAYTPHAPVYFTLHHTQAHYPKNYDEAVAEMQFIQDFHQNGRGWIDIAYHFLIDPAGNIFEGRPIKAMGSHVKNRNTSNVGISILGNFHPPAKDVFTDAARDSFVAIGSYLKDTYEVNVSSFYAHRDIGNSDCPGDGLYAKKELLRDLIFTPQPQGVTVNPGGAPLPTRAQQQSLRQLMRYIEAQPQ